jgi:hypothetical protein
VTAGTFLYKAFVIFSNSEVTDLALAPSSRQRRPARRALRSQSNLRRAPQPDELSGRHRERRLGIAGPHRLDGERGRGRSQPRLDDPWLPRHSVHHRRAAPWIADALRIAPRHPAAPSTASAERRSAWLCGAMRTSDPIGAPGFEPGTSPTRTVRATRLRHAPRGADCGRGRWGGAVRSAGRARYFAGRGV